MRNLYLAVFGVIVLSLGSCSEPVGPAPERNEPLLNASSPLRYESGGQPYCDEVDLIPDGGCIERPGDSGFDEYWDNVALGDNSVRLSMSYAESVAPLPICIPTFAAARVPGTVFPSSGGMVSFVSSGTWVLLSIWDTFGRIGRYDWPEGWWPSVEGDGVSVSVDSADGICDLSMRGQFHITFVSFNGVAFRRPRPPGGGAGVPVGGGGSNPPPGGGGYEPPQMDVLFECSEWTEANGTYHLYCQRV